MISKNILFDKISTASSLIWEKYLFLKNCKVMDIAGIFNKTYVPIIWTMSMIKFLS